MAGKTGIWINKFRGRGVRSFNRDIVIFSFFLLLSFIFWYLNSLRKDFEMDIKYPVRYINPPKGMVIAGELPPKLTFYLKGPGYSIIKLKISGNRAPLIIDFSRIAYRKVPGSRSSEYYILSGGLIQNFSKQLRSEFQLLSIRPDTIFVQFGKKSAAGNTGKSNPPERQIY